MLRDPDQKISRSRQIYLGAGRWDYLPMEKRQPEGDRKPARYRPD